MDDGIVTLALIVVAAVLALGWVARAMRIRVSRSAYLFIAFLIIVGVLYLYGRSLAAH